MASIVTRPSRRSSSGPVLRSLSPSGRFHFPSSPPSSSPSTAFASSSSSFFYQNHNRQFTRSASPPRVYMYGNNATSAAYVRFFVDRPISPNRSISAVKPSQAHLVRRRSATQKNTCMCSPTTHPGSFRCSLHKSFNGSRTVGYSPNRLNKRRSAMTNSLVRIGGVEGELVKRALAALIRSSSHQQRRRAAFRPRPSRLSVMSGAAEK